VKERISKLKPLRDEENLAQCIKGNYYDEVGHSLKRGRGSAKRRGLAHGQMEAKAESGRRGK